MHYAVQTASAPTIKLLLLYNADINAQDRVMMMWNILLISESVSWLTHRFFLFLQDGWTPLHVAVQARRSDMVKLLLIKGADIQVKNKASFPSPSSTPLLYYYDYSDRCRLFFFDSGWVNSGWPLPLPRKRDKDVWSVENVERVSP